MTSFPLADIIIAQSLLLIGFLILNPHLVTLVFLVVCTLFIPLLHDVPVLP